MSSKTKIVVLHMKELIYTGIFAALGILFIVLLIIMFLPGKKDEAHTNTSSPATEENNETEALDSTTTSSLYIPGIYNTELVLNDQTINVEVIVDKDYINSIKLVNLNESITTMYPLLQPTFDSLTAQIYEKQSLENITYQTESKYTSLVILEAIKKSLQKAQLF